MVLGSLARGLVPAPVADRLRPLYRRLTASPELRPVAATEGMLPLEVAELLYRLARELTDGVIVEVGSYRGRSTVALALGAGNDVPVYAIEPHEPFTGMLGGEFGPADRAAFYRAMLRTGMYQRVRLVNLPSRTAARGWELPVGLLWIDGDHRYEAVRADFDAWSRHLTETATVVFDDATDPEIGPHRLIGELLTCGWAEIGCVGRTRTIRRSPV